VGTAFADNDSKSLFDNLSLHILGMPDPYTYISIIVNPRDLTDDQIAMYLEPIEEVTLLNKTFKNVYSNSSSGIFYNCEIGLIGFRDKTDNLWVFEKTEEIE
jgi:hypothetical protein